MKRAHQDAHNASSRPAPRPPEDHVTFTESPEGSQPAKAPKISRKVHACTECQARKIKCDLTPGQTICSRCNNKGLRCVVNKSLQSLLESENEWKTNMENTSKGLQEAVTAILHNLGLPAFESFMKTPGVSYAGQGASNDNAFPLNSQQPPVRAQSQAIRGMAMTRENSREPESGEDGNGLIAAPMGTLYEVTKLRNLRNNPRGSGSVSLMTLEKDFISRGKIAEAEAKGLFDIFSRSLNHYLWGGIVLVHSELSSVRKSSSLLLAAILTVTALHVPGKEKVFDICYAEFVTLVSDSMLDRYHSLDGIRGLCIGAFWLSDLSWKLSGHAVRIATELNLHQSCARAVRGLHENLEGARLWYVLYVCDHHFSIAYGRPPVIHADAAIVGHEKFLSLPGVTQADFRLQSQVAIFIILTDIYNTFGPDVDQRLDEDDLVHVQRYNVALDNWHRNWVTRLSTSPCIGSYPSKGVTLHYNYSKLQLNSLSLRGFQTLAPHGLSHNRRELADMAISIAVANLQLMLNEPDLRNSLVGVPIYLHTMITYTTVFLLKVQRKSSHLGFNLDAGLVSNLVEKVIDFLNDAKASDRHLTYHIAKGLSKMLRKFWAGMRQEFGVDDVTPQPTTNKINAPEIPPSAEGPEYEFGNNYPSVGMFEDPMLFQEDSYYPLGFFDVLSSAIPG